jgi:hypothetical protein
MKTAFHIKTLSVFILLLISARVGAADYYLASGTVAINNVGSWGINTDGTGANPVDFSGASDVWHIANRGGTTIQFSIGSFTIPASALLVIEAGNHLSVEGSAIFTNLFLINVLNTGTLTIISNTNYNLNSMGPNSTVIFGTSSVNVPLITFGNLVIASPQNISATSSFLDIFGTLTINSGQTFDLGSNWIRIYGNTLSFAGTGSLTSNPSSGIILQNGNGGDNGTIFFSSGTSDLGSIYIFYNSSNDRIRLGNNISISNHFRQIVGSFDLNGNRLVIDGTTDCPTSVSNGSIITNASSSLVINSSFIGFFGSNNLVFNGTGSSMQSFTLNSPGRTLNILNALEVNDNLDVTAGTLNVVTSLTLKSNSTLKARLGPMGGSGSITGNVTVETFVPGTSTGWAQLGISGVTVQSIANWDAQIPMSCNGCQFSVAQAGGFTSIQGWDEPTGAYVSTLSASDGLTPGIGHWVYVGSGSVTTSDFTLINTGPVVQGPGTIPITANTSSYNLIANPYASPISWTAFRAQGTNNTKVANAIYGWNADRNSGAGGPIEMVLGVSTPSDITGLNDVIPAGQGFYVQALLASANLDYNESIKVTANTGTNPLLKTSTHSIGKIARLKISSPQANSDETVIRLHPEASTGFDPEFDAFKQFQSPGYVGYPGPYTGYLSISTRLLNKDYSINSLSLSSGTIAIPVLTRVTASGTHTISAFDFAEFENCLVLHDKLNNAYHNLKQSAYVTFISDTTSTPRFELILCESGNTTPVGISELVQNSSILVFETKEGALVKTNFDKNTRACISVYNLMGQKIQDDVFVEGTATETPLVFEAKQQIVFVKVSTENEQVTKKMVTR